MIQSFFESNYKKSYNYKQLAKALSINDPGGKNQIESTLHNMCKQGVLKVESRGKYTLSKEFRRMLSDEQPIITGICDMKQTGKAYIISDDCEEDVLIAPNNTYKALDQDLVKVQLFPKRKDKKLEGRIIEIVKRAKTTFVGTLQISPKYAFLIPDNSSMPVDLFIPIESLKGAKNGQKAIARLTEWPDNAKNPFGEITKVLGYQGDNDVEMTSILADYELPFEFPKEVLSEANKMPLSVAPEHIKGRRDFREATTFTVDPFNAKDYDDALSIEKLDDTKWRIGIHIADVSFYVKPDSIIDKEAYDRATSVYLVDRVIPMLPEVLSNNICSLKPNEDRLCFAVVVDMDINGKIYNQWFGKTVIHSKRRFNYDEVQEIILSKSGELAEEISILNQIAQNLRKKRFKDGSMAFERQEVKFYLDEKGKPIGVKIEEHNESHQLIEEFMLLANRRVAELIGKTDAENKTPKTFVYRIHDDPNPEKLHALAAFVYKFGYKIKTNSRSNTVSSMNQLLKEVNGKGEQNIIESLAIRTMAKAVYSTENIGHYGLAFDYYTHFTSPIRRYPDLMVHRLLERYLTGGSSVSVSEYEAKCDHASEMERKAAEAERDSIKYKQVEFLADKIGQIFEGIISGVSKWGVYVEIKENKCEGMVRLSDLDDDFYYLDEENHCVIGQRYKTEYRLGDSVKIMVKRANLSKKQLDFEMVKENTYRADLGL